MNFGFLKQLCVYLVVMSPSRAEGFSARLDSARDLFHFSSEVKIGQKRAENELKFDSQFS